MTVYEKRKRQERNQRIVWMLTDAVCLVSLIVIMSGAMLVMHTLLN